MNMKFNQLFNPAIIVAALSVIAIWVGFGQDLLTAASWKAGKQDENQQSLNQEELGDSGLKNKVANRKATDFSTENSQVSKNFPPGTVDASEDLLPNDQHSLELLQASLELLRNKSIRSSIRQRGLLFDTELIAAGSYLHAEGGRGGAKTDLELQTQNLDLRIISVNDGVYFFRQVISADPPSVSTESALVIDTESIPTVERINLRKIRENMSSTEIWSGDWIAFGSLYLFVNQIQASFDWSLPKEKKVREKSYQSIRGTWKPARLASLVPAQKESILGKKTLDWERIPHQIPLQVEILLVNEGELAGFPFRIIFYRPNSELMEGVRLTPVLVTEFSDAELIDIPSQSEFQFNAAENEVVDKTDEFLQSLKR